jgi:predicted heme/steroid binding protein
MNSPLSAVFALHHVLISSFTAFAAGYPSSVDDVSTSFLYDKSIHSGNNSCGEDTFLSGTIIG